MKKLPYSEGTWFAVPLRNGQFAVGLIARMASSGKIPLGYFFGPASTSLPTLNAISKYKPSDVAYRCMFGDLGLYKGTWPIIGKVANWDREQWPMPEFFRQPAGTNQSFKILYDPDDPGKEIAEIPIEKVTTDLVQDGLAGSGYVGLVLSDILLGLEG